MEFSKKPDNCPHTETTVTGYERREDIPGAFTQIRQCTICGLYQRVLYNPPKEKEPEV